MRGNNCVVKVCVVKACGVRLLGEFKYFCLWSCLCWRVRPFVLDTLTWFVPLGLWNNIFCGFLVGIKANDIHVQHSCEAPWVSVDYRVVKNLSILYVLLKFTFIDATWILLPLICVLEEEDLFNGTLCFSLIWPKMLQIPRICFTIFYTANPSWEA